jgi:hypothetical protein
MSFWEAFVCSILGFLTPQSSSNSNTLYTMSEPNTLTLIILVYPTLNNQRDNKPSHFHINTQHEPLQTGLMSHLKPLKGPNILVSLKQLQIVKF